MKISLCNARAFQSHLLPSQKKDACKFCGRHVHTLDGSSSAVSTPTFAKSNPLEKRTSRSRTLRGILNISHLRRNHSENLPTSLGPRSAETHLLQSQSSMAPTTVARSSAGPPRIAADGAPPRGCSPLANTRAAARTPARLEPLRRERPRILSDFLRIFGGQFLLGLELMK